ncbi:DUF2807 domain-containing protein [bacterium AH-315-J21]|nr:DUF2807 domain-containing protein [bacterium AH-315-J21]
MRFLQTPLLQSLHVRAQSTQIAIVAMLALAMLATPLTVEASGGSKRKQRRSSHSEIVKQIRDVEGFNRVKVRGIADVEIVFGSEFKVEVEAEEDYIDDFLTERSGKTLTVGLDTDDWNFSGFNWDSDDDSPLKVRITMPKLVRLDIKGIGDVSIDSYKGEALEVNVSGVGSVDLRDFEAKTLELSLSGVSEIEVNGKVDELDVSLSGVGEADLRDLIAREVHASASGMGDITVHATERLVASASGFGDVVYYGRPDKVSKSESGFGDIIAKR